MNNCPKCGGTTFTTRVKVTGYWEELITIREDGRIKREGLGDSIRNQSTPKTARCDGCGKRVKLPENYLENATL